MGCAPAGNRTPCRVLRAAAIMAGPHARSATIPHDVVAAALAPLSADVRLGRRQARHARPDLAWPHGPDVPLRNPAVTNMDRLVRAPVSRVVPEILLRRPVRHR